MTTHHAYVRPSRYDTSDIRAVEPRPNPARLNIVTADRFDAVVVDVVDRPADVLAANTVAGGYPAPPTVIRLTHIDPGGEGERFEFRHEMAAALADELRRAVRAARRSVQ